MLRTAYLMAINVRIDVLPPMCSVQAELHSIEHHEDGSYSVVVYGIDRREHEAVTSSPYTVRGNPPLVRWRDLWPPRHPAHKGT